MKTKTERMWVLVQGDLICYWCVGRTKESCWGEAEQWSEVKRDALRVRGYTVRRCTLTVEAPALAGK